MISKKLGDGILTVENWLFGLRLVFCVVNEEEFFVRNAQKELFFISSIAPDSHPL